MEKILHLIIFFNIWTICSGKSSLISDIGDFLFLTCFLSHSRKIFNNFINLSKNQLLALLVVFYCLFSITLFQLFFFCFLPSSDFEIILFSFLHEIIDFKHFFPQVYVCICPLNNALGIPTN